MLIEIFKFRIVFIYQFNNALSISQHLGLVANIQMRQNSKKLRNGINRNIVKHFLQVT